MRPTSSERGEVCWDVNASCSGRFHFLNDSLRAFGAAGGDGYAGSFAGESKRGGAADSGTAAGDKDNSILEERHILL
jgi:hypothetical protein